MTLYLTNCSDVLDSHVWVLDYHSPSTYIGYIGYWIYWINSHLLQQCSYYEAECSETFHSRLSDDRITFREGVCLCLPVIAPVQRWPVARGEFPIISICVAHGTL